MWQKVGVSKNIFDGEQQFFLKKMNEYQVSCLKISLSG